MAAYKGELVFDTFTDVNDALAYVERFKDKRSFLYKCIAGDDEAALDHSVLDVDFRSIKDGVFDRERFDQLSVIVADFAMPEMNGAEFFKKIGPTNSKKILLTGEVGYDLAVEAFNDGIIDKFILKAEPELPEVLLHAIRELQYEYYCSLSDKLLAVLGEKSPAFQCLTDSGFVRYFNDLCQQKEITEFYLTDSHGGFVMLDSAGRPSWLAVKSESDLQDFFDVANDSGDAPADILEMLQNKTGVPYFFSDHDLSVPPSEWEAYVHKATKVPGGYTNYYVAELPDKGIYQLDDSRQILTFEEYLSGR